MKKFKNQEGFTILESIIAILILSLSISGAFSAVQQSLSQSIISKDEVKAFYLAQEAVEIIRNKRDANQIIKINTGSGDWLDGIIGPSDCSLGGICKVDAKAADKIQSCSSSCENLKQDTLTFLYNYNPSGDDTNFNREIQIESISPNEIAVIVRITWTKGSLITRELKVKTLLFNWI
jgi:prepilin-type N-terminal cleavage/methylation domain-containing protein